MYVVYTLIMAVEVRRRSLILGSLGIAVAGSACAKPSEREEIPIPQYSHPWKIRSIDTMKQSRDMARNPDITPAVIDRLTGFVKDTNATHVAIGTPYDEEFRPIMEQWVHSARGQGLDVWFRGNFSEFERDHTNPDQGWFGTLHNPNHMQHPDKVRGFILENPALFQDGDIFTPWPEPENKFGGYIDDSRGEFHDLLLADFRAARESLDEIGKPGVRAGYTSTNGDVALRLDHGVVRETGNIVVLDHYTPTPEEMGSRIAKVHELYPGVEVVIGEYGAPIPDINGEMTQDQQAEFVGQILDQMKRSDISGANYWTLLDGSTALMDLPEGVAIPIKRKVFNVVQQHYGSSPAS